MENKRTRMANKKCLPPKTAVELYNSGVALYNIVSRSYAFKHDGKHYTSKDIARKNQHTFRKQIWVVSYLNVEDDLAMLLKKSKVVKLTQSNHNTGIIGKYSKHVEGKTVKNQVKGEFKKLKHFMNNVLFSFRKIGM